MAVFVKAIGTAFLWEAVAAPCRLTTETCTQHFVTVTQPVPKANEDRGAATSASSLWKTRIIDLSPSDWRGLLDAIRLPSQPDPAPFAYVLGDNAPPIPLRPAEEQQGDGSSCDAAEAQRSDCSAAAASPIACHVVQRREGDFNPNNMLYWSLRYKFRLPPSFVAETPTALLELQKDNHEPPVSFPEKLPIRPYSEEQSSVGAHNKNTSSESVVFWPHRNPRGCVVFQSAHFMVLVNLKPIVRSPGGHLLIVPLSFRRDLHGLETEEEATDWANTIHRATQAVATFRREKQLPFDGFSVAVQQTAISGQTVPHLHAHLIVYTASGELSGAPESDDEEKRMGPRSAEEMAAEANALRGYF